MKLLEKAKILLRKTIPPPWDESTYPSWQLLLSLIWCYHFHRRISRPVQGHYTCFECGKKWEALFK